MLQEFRRDKRDHYFLSPRGWRKVQERKKKGWGLWYSLSGYALSLIVVALVILQVLVDFIH